MTDQDRKKLHEWIDTTSLDLPPKVDGSAELMQDILLKLMGFKKWAKKLVDEHVTNDQSNQ